ncbi:FecR domain-containing protein [Chitinophaga sedimenti]|uniref:FecR family protein n=1 Tax=Chitinophaga sedimenti TaxID=2033606 RepID=UPI002003A082|nr:FecR family protein [Chitinophaga sedimenti]MCK7559357.1 FecR domain-containing protein [Chitinophaga sedimenti]
MERDDLYRLVTDDLNGDISPEDKILLDKLLAEKLEYRLLYEDFKNIHSGTDIAGELDKLDHVIAFEQTMSAAKPPKTRRGWYWTAAAVFAGGLALGATVLMNSNRQVASPSAAARKKPTINLQLPDGQIIDLAINKGTNRFGDAVVANEGDHLTVSGQNLEGKQAILQVPPGLEYKITLSDGTDVKLNSASTLIFPTSFGDGDRVVSVQGEAYFKVSKNAEKPFVVKLRSSAVKVIGTEFNVNTYRENAEQVALVEGRVKIGRGADSLTLVPGEQAVYGPAGKLLATSFDKMTVLGWMTGVYYFSDAPLEEVFKVIPRWFGVNVQFDNNVWKQHHFTGAIERNKPVTHSLNAIKSLGLVDYYFDKDSVIHIK